MAKRIEKTLSVGIVTLAVVACSGASDSGLFASGVQSSSTSSGQSGSSSSGASSSASSSSGFSTSSGASGGVVDGGRSEGGTDQRLGPGGDAARIACGAEFCALAGGGRCCVHHAMSYTGACATSTMPTCAAGDTSLRCGSNANCGTGLVCCVEGSNGNYLSDCRTNCNSGTRQPLCDPNMTPTGCAPGTTCSTAAASTVGLPNTYGICVSVIPH